MIIIIIYFAISFLLDGFISNYIPFELTNPSFFKTIYSVIAITITCHYFDNLKKYLYLLIPLGILFDIVYTNTFILNIILFLIIYIIVKQLDYFLPNNLLTMNIKSIISLFIYHILTYLILLLADYNSYDFNILIIILYKSIIMTIIYTTISYIILRKINIKKIR